MDKRRDDRPARTLVLGIGNTLLGDEGIGVHALALLREHFEDREDIDYLDGGTLSFTLAGPIEDCERLIVIDAAQLHAEPGSVATFSNTAMDDYLNQHRKRSVHEVGLIDLMVIARLTDRLPKQRALIGIQPELVDWRETPSPAVAAALPRVAAQARALIEDWDHATT